MLDFVPLAITILLTLAIGFVSSLVEGVLLSTPQTHIEVMVRQGKRSGVILRHLKDRIDRPLIAILSLNMIANMMGSAAVGAQVSELSEARHVSGAIWVGLAAGALTLTGLVGSEIIPKTLGATYWQQLAAPSAYVIQTTVWALYPAVRAMEFIPRLIAGRAAPRVVTGDEVLALVELAQEAGGLPEREARVLSNLLKLKEIRTYEVMTPRVQVFSLQKDRTAADVVAEHPNLPFSRIPIYSENADHIVGYVLRYGILEACFSGRGSTTLDALKKPIHVVPETKSAASLLDEFIQRRDYIFLVVNEYGGTEGIVTLEDVIETLLGVEFGEEMGMFEELRRMAVARERERRRKQRKQKEARKPPKP